MKKTLAFLSALMLMTAAFVSCGNKGSSKSKSGGSSTVDKSDDDNGGNDEDEEPVNALVGTWIPDDKTLESLMDSLDGMEFEKIEYIFTDTEMQLNAKMDMSEMFSITDDGFIVSGQKFDKSYDGEVITVTTEGMTLAEFTRVDKADKDNIYGKYSNEEMSGIAEGGEMLFEFPESGVSYMIMNMTQKYTYDEENSKIITVENGEEEEVEIKLDGDNLTLISESDGELSFTRAK